MGEGLKRARDAARATRQPARKITEAKCARLVAAMEAIRECEDCPNDLVRAFDDARAAISPWYDTEG